jgi:hypothetical protein
MSEFVRGYHGCQKGKRLPVGQSERANERAREHRPDEGHTSHGGFSKRVSGERECVRAKHAEQKRDFVFVARHCAVPFLCVR